MRVSESACLLVCALCHRLRNLFSILFSILFFIDLNLALLLPSTYFAVYTISLAREYMQILPKLAPAIVRCISANWFSQ